MNIDESIKIFKEGRSDLDIALDHYKELSGVKGKRSPIYIENCLKKFKSKNYVKTTQDSEAICELQDVMNELYEMFETIKMANEKELDKPLQRHLNRGLSIKEDIEKITRSLNWIHDEERYKDALEQKLAADKALHIDIRKGDTIIRPGESWTPIPKRVFRKPAGI